MSFNDKDFLNHKFVYHPLITGNNRYYGNKYENTFTIIYLICEICSLSIYIFKENLKPTDKITLTCEEVQIKKLLE